MDSLCRRSFLKFIKTLRFPPTKSFSKHIWIENVNGRCQMRHDVLYKGNNLCTSLPEASILLSLPFKWIIPTSLVEMSEKKIRLVAKSKSTPITLLNALIELYGGATTLNLSKCRVKISFLFAKRAKLLAFLQVFPSFSRSPLVQIQLKKRETGL